MKGFWWSEDCLEQNCQDQVAWIVPLQENKKQIEVQAWYQSNKIYRFSAYSTDLKHVFITVPLYNNKEKWN